MIRPLIEMPGVSRQWVIALCAALIVRFSHGRILPPSGWLAFAFAGDSSEVLSRCNPWQRSHLLDFGVVVQSFSRGWLKDHVFISVSADLKGSHCGRLGCEPEMSAMMAGNTSALTAVRNKQSWFRDFSPRAKVSSWALLPRRPLQA